MTSAHSFNHNHNNNNNNDSNDFFEINMKNINENDDFNWQEKAAKFQAAVRMIITYF